MNVKLEVNKAKSKGLNKSMYRINIRAKLIKSRIQNYYLHELREQEHKNDINKLIIR